jgi:homoserine kinase
VSSFNPLKVQKLPVPENFHCVLFTPKIEVSTKSARQALPSTVPFSIAVKQAQRAAAFVDACYRNNSSDALTNMIDLLAEPARKAFIPHFDILKSAAIDAGALSFGISGSGSTLIACTASTEAACHIEAALSEVYAKMDLAYSSLRSRPCQLGARLVDSGVTL